MGEIQDAIREQQKIRREADHNVAVLLDAQRIVDAQSTAVKVGRDRDSDSIGAQVRNAAVDILTARRPLHRSAIYQELEKRDLVFGGQDPVQQLSAYLSRDARFLSLNDTDKGCWTLVDRAAPAVPSDGAVA